MVVPLYLSVPTLDISQAMSLYELVASGLTGSSSRNASPSLQLLSEAPEKASSVSKGMHCSHLQALQASHSVGTTISPGSCSHRDSLGMRSARSLDYHRSLQAGNLHCSLRQQHRFQKHLHLHPQS